MESSALALPLVVGWAWWPFQEWIGRYWRTIAVVSMWWLYLGIVACAALSVWMLKYGHPRDWEQENEKQAKYLRDWQIKRKGEYKDE